MIRRSVIRILVFSGAFAIACTAQAVTVPLNRSLLSGDTYQRLNSAQQMMQSGDYNGSLATLGELASRVKNNNYEYAITELNIAYVYINHGDYRSALPPMLGAVQQHAMPQTEQLGAVLDLGKLYARAGQYDDAQRVVNAYLKADQSPPPDADMLVADIYAGLGQCRSALPYAKRALDNDSSAPESWY
ncbi:MAG: tetratricopeptide repeat protein, partial [Gammaproteobacteria bacterium]